MSISTPLRQWQNKQIKNNAIQFNKNKIATWERFYKQIIERDSHWLWQPTLRNSRDRDFHVEIKNGKRVRMAPVIYSYFYHIGPVENRRHIKRNCGETACVNPEHLYYLSTPKIVQERKNRKKSLQNAFARKNRREKKELGIEPTAEQKEKMRIYMKKYDDNRKEKRKEYMRIYDRERRKIKKN